MTHDRLLHSRSASTSYRCSQVVGFVALALAARGRKVVKLSFYPRGRPAPASLSRVPRSARNCQRGAALHRSCAVVPRSLPLFRRPADCGCEHSQVAALHAK